MTRSQVLRIFPVRWGSEKYYYKTKGRKTLCGGYQEQKSETLTKSHQEDRFMGLFFHFTEVKIKERENNLNNGVEKSRKERGRKEKWAMNQI